MKAFALPLLLAASVAACAQLNPDDVHAGHHPGPGPGGGPAAMAARDASAPAGFERQMQQMQDMHRRMQAATTPAQRQALMDEHMKLMQSGMAMMQQMGPGAAMAGGPGGAPGPAGAAAAGATGPGGSAAPMAQGMQGMGGMAGGMGGMMAMHDAMVRRMAMMEMMMQMMVDREGAVSRP